MTRSRTLEEHRLRIARAVEHLETHLDEPLDVASLARVACISEFHFHRVFRAIVGESAMSHVRRLRLERAARQLRTSDRKVIEIALEAGFEAHEAFTRAFSSQFGVSPSDYRRAHARAASHAPVSPPPSFARVETREPVAVLALRHVGAYSDVGATWSALHAAASSRGLAGDAYGLCHDDPEVTDPSRFRYDACLAVGAVDPFGELRSHTIAGGTYAVGIHRGSYSSLGESYGLLTRWALERDLAVAPDASVERYLAAPGSAPGAVIEIALRIG
ncbi:AraC family transcriptional regulator [Sorangium sp. So ce1335]|uniref:AraC family transcriptional regulator n=1 Tax=Sorangium sp. So ce1335 TaxID=3133335 RepID=UPI003F5F429A